MVSAFFHFQQLKYEGAREVKLTPSRKNYPQKAQPY